MEQLVFIGGMPRSGINLLRTMLDCHSQVAAGPALQNMESITNLFISLTEAHNNNGPLSSYIPEPEFTSLLQGFVEGIMLPYARRKGKSIAVESSANTLWAMPVLAQLFPTAKFINVVRDGRDIVSSNRRVAQRLEAKGLPDTNNLASALHTASLWRDHITLGHSVCGPQSDLAREGRALTVHYEDLAMGSVSELQRICRLLSIDFEEGMLRPHQHPHDTYADDIWLSADGGSRPLSTDSIGNWLNDLNFRDRMLFMAAGQDALVAMGYERDVEWSFRNITISQEDAMLEIELVNEELALLMAEGEAADSAAQANDGSLKIEKVVVEEATPGSSGTHPASQLTPGAPSPSPSSLPLRR